MDTDWTFSSRSWLWEEDVTFKKSCSDSDWSREEDKAFENALAIYYNDADRWDKIALAVPGKTIEDLKLHYEALSDDVAAIESGKIHLPHYPSKVGVRQKRKKSSTANMQRGIPWTEEEHRRFLYGLQRFGRGDWKSISRYSVRTKSNSQVASHAQKYFKRLNAANEGKRPSINDIRSVHPDSLLSLEKATTSCMPGHPKEKSTDVGNQKLLPRDPKKASTNHGNQLLPGYTMDSSTNVENQLLPVYSKKASTTGGDQLLPGYPKEASTIRNQQLLPGYPMEASTSPGNELLHGYPKGASTNAGSQLVKGYPKEASTDAASQLLPGYHKEASTDARSQLLPGYPKEASTNADSQLFPENPKGVSANADSQLFPEYPKGASNYTGDQLLPGYLKEASTNVGNELPPVYPKEVSANAGNQPFLGYPRKASTNVENQLLPHIPFADMSVFPFSGHAIAGPGTSSAAVVPACSMFTFPSATHPIQEPGPSVGMPANHPPVALIQNGGVPPAGSFDMPSTSYSEVMDLDMFVFPYFLD